jgi:ribosomal-protein-alanine N-acetyltransferase
MLGISQRSFTIPWSVASFEAEFYKDFSYLYIYTKEQGSTIQLASSATAVGYLIIWDIQGEGEVVALAVDKGWRNRGIGSALLSFAIEAHRVKVWHLEVDPVNSAAIGLYEKHGFKKNRVIRNYYGQGKDAMQMSREI